MNTPDAVKRVEIPKPDGGIRKLGIPTVKSLRIKGCETTLKEIKLPPSVRYIGACAFRNFEEIYYTCKKNNTVDIIVSINNNMFGAFTKIKRVVIDSKYPNVELQRNVGELVIKGKDTKVVSYRANDAFDKTVITTVHKAKVISFVKKNKMSYKVIRDIAVKLVKGKKSKNEFVYKWNKSKPMVIYYTYNTSW